MNTINNNITLDERLSCAASLVREGAVICDVGTDHAYIPVYLLKSGTAAYAAATDINKGPLERARLNAEKYGVSDKITFVLTDGLCGVELAELGVSDILICGMGGELISRILDASEYIMSRDIRLILQPMSHADELRAYLWDNGFNILNERLCKAAGRVYTCIHSEYDGIIRKHNKAELILGKACLNNRGVLFAEYADTAVKKLRTQIDGMRSGGIDVSEQENILSELLDEIRKYSEQ